MEKTSPKPKTVASPLGPARVVAEAAVAADGRAGEELVVQRLDTAEGRSSASATAATAACCAAR